MCLYVPSDLWFGGFCFRGSNKYAELRIFALRYGFCVFVLNIKISSQISNNAYLTVYYKSYKANNEVSSIYIPQSDKSFERRAKNLCSKCLISSIVP